uniref:Uncharacterized protein n=1 Tax=Caenorhabditis japonica TaxID=281687 RepID=A0A8R1HKV0_CAEJA
MSELISDSNDYDSALYYDPYYQMLIPKSLKNLGIRLRSAGIRVSRDSPTNMNSFTYVMSWHDSIGSDDKYVKALNTAQNKLNYNAIKSEVSTGSREQTSVQPKQEKSVSKKEKKLVRKSRGKKCSRSSKKCKKSSVSSRLTLEKKALTSSSAADSGGGSGETTTDRSPYYDNITVSESVIEKAKKKKEEEEEKSKNSSQKLSSSIPSVFGTLSEKSYRSLGSSKYSTFATNRTNVSGTGTVYTTASDPNDLESLTVKLVFIECEKFHGPLRPLTEVTATASTLAKSIFLDVLRKYRSALDPEAAIRRATLFFAFRNGRGKQKLRRVRAEDVDKIVVCNFPRIGNCVCLILDFIEHIEKGKQIPIRFFEE